MTEPIEREPFLVQHFTRLVGQLRRAGYRVRVTNSTTYGRYAEFSNAQVRGLIEHSYPNTPADHPSLGRLCADNQQVFNKWSQCPLFIRLPRSFETIQAQLAILASDAGAEYSNRFGYLDEERLLLYEREG